MKIVTKAEMQAIEKSAHMNGISTDTLMKNAGRGIADNAEIIMGGVQGKSVVVLIGAGNNGGDGIISAVYLRNYGASVTIFICVKSRVQDKNIKKAESLGILVYDVSEGDKDRIVFNKCLKADLIIDGILGTGNNRQIKQPLSEILSGASESNTTVLAIDVPTGLDSDTGCFDEHGLKANVTGALGYAKLGSISNQDRTISGSIKVIDIGIPNGLDTKIQKEIIDKPLIQKLLPVRKNNTNKGTFGKTIIFAGSPSYIGAAALAGRAALRSGVGLVCLALSARVYEQISGTIDEVIFHVMPKNDNDDFILNKSAGQLAKKSGNFGSFLIGPGLGQEVETIKFFKTLIKSIDNSVPLIFDADALNILSNIHKWWEIIDNPKILTPHPGELSRLLGISVKNIQENRIETAKIASKTFNSIVVLKGAGTIIADPKKYVRISPWANSGLAKAGTGDVLSGLLAGILAQMPNPLFDAASLSVYLHGLAGDLSKKKYGTYGMVASDVISCLPDAFRTFHD